MHRPKLRHTITALVALGLASLALSACGGKPKKDPSQMNGYELFQANCARCHGRAGEGSFQAPNLDSIAAHWDVERLGRYMHNPELVIAEDERLREHARRYSQRMPAFPQLDPTAREKIATWLLGRN